MRKILISILIVLLLLVGYLVIFRGLNILGLEILSISGIQDKNIELNNNLEHLGTLTSIDKPKAIADLNDSLKQLQIAKEEYNDKILYSSNEDIQAASITRPYETEYLMVRLGNHAKNYGIVLRYELRQTSGVAGEYDIYFTITGSYVGISEFISSLEKDSSLNFKIENFKLVPTTQSTETLQSTFVVKAINVKVDRRVTSSNASNTNTNTNTSDTNNTNTLNNS